MKKSVILWILALLLTLGAAVYQRLTGPTHPLRVTYGEDIEVRLPRSHGGDGGCPVDLDVEDSLVTGTMRYRRYPTDEEWSLVPFVRDGGRLSAELPHQPPAGKLEYLVVLERDGKSLATTAESAAIIRFKGYVPPSVLIPHIIFMFAAMLISTLAGLKAVFGAPRAALSGLIALILLVVGGLILGPIVQNHAFGEYWTGFPLGYDLTDNKVAIAFVVWSGALLLNLRWPRRVWIVVAAVVLMAVYSIPHSALGSELDPATGRVKTGRSGG